MGKARITYLGFSFAYEKLEKWAGPRFERTANAKHIRTSNSERRATGKMAVAMSIITSALYNPYLLYK